MACTTNNTGYNLPFFCLVNCSISLVFALLILVSSSNFIFNSFTFTFNSSIFSCFSESTLSESTEHKIS